MCRLKTRGTVLCWCMPTYINLNTCKVDLSRAQPYFWLFCLNLIHNWEGIDDVTKVPCWIQAQVLYIYGIYTNRVTRPQQLFFILHMCCKCCIKMCSNMTNTKVHVTCFFLLWRLWSVKVSVTHTFSMFPNILLASFTREWIESNGINITEEEPLSVLSNIRCFISQVVSVSLIHRLQSMVW